MSRASPMAEVQRGRPAVPARHRSRSLLTASGYALAAACLAGAWALRDQNLIHAGDGLGYWFGIAGASLMALLLLYPLRKRARILRDLGRVSFWFRLHMLFGVIGPILIVLHTNFRLGSFNGRIALFATLVVAGSGIVGRYIYAKLHHGLYGRKATLQELRAQVEALRDQAGGVSTLLSGVTSELAAYESRLLEESPGVIGAFGRALTVVPRTLTLRWRLKRRAGKHLGTLARSSRVLAEHRERILDNMHRHLGQRIAALRKFAQFRAFQKLFSLWHVVHYPLFLILVVAAVVHVLAVHMY